MVKGIITGLLNGIYIDNSLKYYRNNYRIYWLDQKVRAVLKYEHLKKIYIKL